MTSRWESPTPEFLRGIASEVAAGMSVAAVAEKQGVSRQAVYNWLKAANAPKPSDMGIDGAPRGKAKITRLALRELLEKGLETKAIARHFGVQPPAVCSACHRFGLPLPGEGRRSAQAATAPVPAAAAVLDAEIEIGAGLLATGGRHADLAVWAERNGLTLVQARQRWHALRLPVRKREPAE